MREFNLDVIEDDPINLNVDNVIYLANGGGGGTKDYDLLENKPQINGVVLQGNRTFDSLGIGAMSVQEIERILYLDT